MELEDGYCRGLNNENWAPLKGFLRGVYKGSIVGFYNLGALIVLIGFWGPLYYKHNKEHPKIV